MVLPLISSTKWLGITYEESWRAYFCFNSIKNILGHVLRTITAWIQGLKMCSFTWPRLSVPINIFNISIEVVPEVILLVNPHVLFYKVSRHLDAKNGATKFKYPCGSTDFIHSPHPVEGLGELIFVLIQYTTHFNEKPPLGWGCCEASSLPNLTENMRNRI